MGSIKAEEARWLVVVLVGRAWIANFKPVATYYATNDNFNRFFKSYVCDYIGK